MAQQRSDKCIRVASHYSVTVSSLWMRWLAVRHRMGRTEWDGPVGPEACQWGQSKPTCNMPHLADRPLCRDLPFRHRARLPFHFANFVLLSFSFGRTLMNQARDSLLHHAQGWAYSQARGRKSQGAGNRLVGVHSERTWERAYYASATRGGSGVFQNC